MASRIETPAWAQGIEQMNTTELIDYYGVLGIPVDADLSAIKSAYRRLALVNHPDRGGTHEKMLIINEAFQVLVNPVSRADYDRLRSHTADAITTINAEHSVRNAAAQAGNYPSRSEDIDEWM